MQTMDQQRAKFALQGVTNAKAQLKTDQCKEYHSHVSALPFMIHANGLGQAAAFYKSKAVKNLDYELIYQLLSDWLIKDNQPFHGRTDLLDGITNCDMQAYIAAQAEAMVFINWVKRFAEAYMREAEENNANPSI
jgi:CRISPR-associated protein Cmr5